VTDGGKIHFAVKGVGAGQKLAARIEVLSFGQSLLGASPVTGNLNADLTLDLPAGTYYVNVMGGAGYEYGNLGQYSLSVNVVTFGNVSGTFNPTAPRPQWTTMMAADAGQWLASSTPQAGSTDDASLLAAVPTGLDLQATQDAQALASSTPQAGSVDDASLLAALPTGLDLQLTQDVQALAAAETLGLQGQIQTDTQNPPTAEPVAVADPRGMPADQIVAADTGMLPDQLQPPTSS
jgi:hypothetical protein